MGESRKKIALWLSLMAAAAYGAETNGVVEAAARLTDGEIWNQGVDYYRNHDTTNALRVLRPLILSKTHGARAAEVVAALVYDEARKPGATDAIAKLEEASDTAQIALRANPGDERARKNFARTVQHLPELRDKAHREAVLRAAGDPASMLSAATDESRAIFASSATYMTNDAVRAVAEADRLAQRAGKLADTWICVKEAICQSVTNQEEAATMTAQVDEAAERTARAARELGDLDEKCYETMSAVENDFTRFLKRVILPPQAIERDLTAQSNAWQDVESLNGRAWQQEALDFTRSFRAKFPAWARAYEQQAQADTNRAPFTAEDQAKISALATELEKLQLECTEKNLPPQQEKSLELIRQISELLPKDKNNQGGQSQQNDKSDGKNQNQQQQQQQQQDDKRNDQNDEVQQDDPGGKSEEDKAEEKEAKAGEEDEKKKDDEAVDALLKKAQERNDEHEEDKRRRARKIPLRPGERDW